MATLVLQATGRNCKVLFYLFGDVSKEREARERTVLAHRVKQLEASKSAPVPLFDPFEEE